MKRAVIFTNGNLSNTKSAKELVKKNDYIICVDGGTKHALKAKIKPDLVIGDLDSLPLSSVKKLEKSGVRIEKYPPEKDETDFELAVKEAIKRGHKEFLIFGFIGDRLDHLFSSLFLLANIYSINDLNIKIIEGNQEIFFIRDSKKIKGSKGDLLSLIPIVGDVKGVVTKNLYYPLNNEPLLFGPPRGVSNVFVESIAQVSVKAGILMAIHQKIT